MQKCVDSWLLVLNMSSYRTQFLQASIEPKIQTVITINSDFSAASSARFLTSFNEMGEIAAVCSH